MDIGTLTGRNMYEEIPLFAFDPSLLVKNGTELYYDNVLVEKPGGLGEGWGRQVFDGSVIGGRTLNEEEAISLWQQAYFTFRKPADPEELAAAYRRYHNICDTCCGDGYLIKTDYVDDLDNTAMREVCTLCNGTGRRQ